MLIKCFTWQIYIQSIQARGIFTCVVNFITNSPSCRFHGFISILIQVAINQNNVYFTRVSISFHLVSCHLQNFDKYG